jgi:hypothetical protein
MLLTRGGDRKPLALQPIAVLGLGGHYGADFTVPVQVVEGVFRQGKVRLTRRSKY